MGNCVATCVIPDTNVPEIADLDITGRQEKILELVKKNRSVNQPWSEAEHLIEKEKTHNRSQFVTRYSNVHFLQITRIQIFPLWKVLNTQLIPKWNQFKLLQIMRLYPPRQSVERKVQDL